MLVSDNKIGTDTVNILGSTDEDQLGSTLGSGYRNTIGLVVRNDMGCPIGSFDGSVLLDGKEFVWFVSAKSPTQFPHSEQS